MDPIHSQLSRLSFCCFAESILVQIQETGEPVLWSRLIGSSSFFLLTAVLTTKLLHYFCYVLFIILAQQLVSSAILLQSSDILRPTSCAYSATVLASVLSQAMSDAVLQGLARIVPLSAWAPCTQRDKWYIVYHLCLPSKKQDLLKFTGLHYCSGSRFLPLSEKSRSPLAFWISSCSYPAL